MTFNKKIIVIACISALSAPAMAATGGDGVGTPVCGYDIGSKNIACGSNAQANGGMATTVGFGSDASSNGTAYGFWSAAGDAATALGGNAMATGTLSIAIGSETVASGFGSIMIGAGGSAAGQDSVAIGNFATTTGSSSVALGAGSTDGGKNNVVSVGGVGAERQIINVAAGTATTDAVNLGQLNAVETIARSADAKATTALTTANSADAKATTALTTANSADAKATTALTTANSADAKATTALTTANSADAKATTALTTANNASAQVADLSSKAVTYSDAATVTLRDNNGSGTVVHNVADGVTNRDAANIGQLNSTEVRIMAAVHTLIETGACTYTGGNLQCGGAKATGQNSVATGTNALSSGAGSVATGTNARATGTNSVALGAGSVATGTNSVALGAGSVATRNNTVSIGNPEAGLSRVLTGVGRGVLPTDAVNVEQFKEGLSTTLRNANRYAAQATASALAIPHAHINSGHNNAVAVSVGQYDGYSAIGLSYSHRIDNNAEIQAGVGTGGSNIAARAGINVSW